MPKNRCRHHGNQYPCSCAMGRLYRFVEPLTLFLLKKRGRSYGYELLRDMQGHELTDSEVEAGAMYRTLRRLEANGFVVSCWSQGTVGPDRRLYDLTGAGEEHLREWMVVLEHLCASMIGFVQDVKGLVEPIAAQRG